MPGGRSLIITSTAITNVSNNGVGAGGNHVSHALIRFLVLRRVHELTSTSVAHGHAARAAWSGVYALEVPGTTRLYDGCIPKPNSVKNGVPTCLIAQQQQVI